MIVLSTGTILTLFDLVMEPVAIALNYWRWDQGSVPIDNYITWFILSSISGYLLVLFNAEKNSSLLVLLFGKSIFFILLLLAVLLGVFN
jgi:putative membrane protein